jgi:type I restriction enzyme R subunit
LIASGWSDATRVRKEAGFTRGGIIVRGRLVSQGQGKRADDSLSVKPKILIALIEAKDNRHAAGVGMQQGMGHAGLGHKACGFRRAGADHFDHEL